MDSECFWINKFNVSSLRGRIPPDMLFVSSFNAPLTFPFCIRVLNCFEIAAMSPDLCVDFSWDWIAFASVNNSYNAPLCHKTIRRSNALT